MRTTIDLPEATLRQLKARAAMSGVPMKDLVLEFVERGLAQQALPKSSARRSALPTIVPDKPLALRNPSNAKLLQVLHEQEIRATAPRRSGR
ncbi:MAG TPA: hypothetical protein PLB41_06315 [Rubrivivax sp.]|nr:hypothetical protein [Rubrivivax sp.]HPO21156.1 hypothetical protein [Rubrivivax sp.]